MDPAGLLRAALALAAVLAASGAFILKHPTQPAHARHLTDLRKLYIETLKKSVTGVLLQTQRVTPGTDTRQLQPFNLELRTTGQDWPAQGLTMVGLRRLDNLEMLADKLRSEGVPGDFIECGVWRGGASIFMRGLLRAHDIRDRTVHLVDSFNGLPKASTSADDDSWNSMHYLEVPQEDVRAAFERYGLLDEQVQFHKGYFRDSLPPVRKGFKAKGGSIALLRMDGDMFESTMDILFNLADLLSPGACIVVDDWSIPVCQQAMRKFFELHDLAPTIEPIDQTAVYFCLKNKITLEGSWYKDFNARRSP